jgi:hypothetical protein
MRHSLYGKVENPLTPALIEKIWSYIKQAGIKSVNIIN